MKSVDSSSANSVKLTTADGQVFRAKHVVVTSSLGCLKQGDITFTPALPANKTKAIQDMVSHVLPVSPVPGDLICRVKA